MPEAGPQESEEPELLRDVARAMLSDEPLNLLAHVSSLLAAFDPRARNPLDRRGGQVPLPTLDELVESFLGVDRPETSALLAVIAEIGLDQAPDTLRRAVGTELARRAHALPAWLGGLGAAEVHRAIEMTHVLGDGDNIMLELLLPSGHDLSIVAYIDHNLGTLVKDAFVVPGSVDELVDSMRGVVDDPDTSWGDLDLADARARITAAIELGAMTFPPFVTDTWPACRPLVEWACRLLPAGGRGYPRPRWTDADKAALTERFFASRAGRSFDDLDHRDLFETLLWFGTDDGPGDPLRWSPPAVEILLLDWLPRKVIADASFLAQAPALLRALVRFAHAERGVRPALTDQTVAAIDRCEPEFLRTIVSERPRGSPSPLARLAGYGQRRAGGLLDTLARQVGGFGVLERLDGRALPDEPFVWDDIADDIRDTVATVVELCDRCCDQLFDLEHRTACRRFVHRVATGDPGVFRRRGRTDTAAAAVCWVIGRANHSFGGPTGEGLLVKDMTEWFGLKQAGVSQRAVALLRAAGVDEAESFSYTAEIGSPDLLVSARRRRLMTSRDRHSPG